MVKVGEKLLWVTLVAVVLLLGFAESSEHEDLKPKSVRIARSGPSPPTPRSMSRPFFGMLPKGTPVPPSGPSGSTSDRPIPPSGLSKPSPPISRPNFGMLPKGTPIPPSGPSRSTSDRPVPPYGPSLLPPPATLGKK